MAVVPDSFVDDVARRFALLADPTRLKIVSVLHDAGECSVGEIALAAGTSVANTSQHLRRLAAGGIVGRRRDGQAVRYQIIDDTIERLCSVVCAGLVSRCAASGRIDGGPPGTGLTSTGDSSGQGPAPHDTGEGDTDHG